MSITNYTMHAMEQSMLRLINGLRKWANMTDQRLLVICFPPLSTDTYQTDYASSVTNKSTFLWNTFPEANAENVS